MAMPLIAPMPDNVDIDAYWTLQVTALDPTDGSVVSGVNVSTFSLEVVNLSGGPDADLGYGPFMLVPGPGA